MRKRARLAEKLVLQNPEYMSYSCISYGELEMAKNEEEMFDLLTHRAINEINRQ